MALGWLLSGSLAALWGTAKGWALQAKVAMVTGLLVPAALNKRALVPALTSAAPHKTSAICRSIAVEAAMVVAILVTAAALTTVTTASRSSIRRLRLATGASALGVLDLSSMP